MENNYHKFFLKNGYCKIKLFSAREIKNFLRMVDNRVVSLCPNIDKLNKYFKTNYSLLDSDKENYLVEHSSNLYIIGEDLIVKRIIAHGLPYTEITKAVKKLID